MDDLRSKAWQPSLIPTTPLTPDALDTPLVSTMSPAPFLAPVSWLRLGTARSAIEQSSLVATGSERTLVAEQLRLEGIDAPRSYRLRPAAVLLGRFWIAECRAILAAAKESLD